MVLRRLHKRRQLPLLAARRGAGQGTKRYSEDVYLQFTSTDASAANGALVGIGSTCYVVIKLARNIPVDSSSSIFAAFSDESGDAGKHAIQLTSVPIGGAQRSYETLFYDQLGFFGSMAKQNPAWGPTTICAGIEPFDGVGPYGVGTLVVSAAHVSVSDQEFTAVTRTFVTDYTDLRTGNFGCQVPLVSLTALRVKPTSEQLNAFSRKGVMAWTVFGAANIYQHYHVGGLFDDGGTWKLKRWEGGAGPDVDMVLDSAISDANLVPWTTPAIPWPTQPKALVTGDLVSGDGVRWLESQTGRVFNSATGLGCWAKCTRTADGAATGVNRYAVGYVGSSQALNIQNSASAFPGPTTQHTFFAPHVPSTNFGVSGDMLPDKVSAIGNEVDSTGEQRAYNTGVKVTPSVKPPQALDILDRIVVSSRADTPGVSATGHNANHMMQECFTLDRISVGDEWLTYSNNLGVDPRLVWGMAGTDNGGALQHVYAIAYIDIATQKVPDLIDGAAAADSLDVQGVAATATHIIDIGTDGKPVP